MKRLTRRNAFLGLVVLAVAALLAAARARPIGVMELPRPCPAPGQAEPAYVEGQILVKFKPQTGVVVRAAAFVALETRLVRRLSRLDIYLLTVPPGESIDGFVEIFGRNPDVEYAEPNYLLRASVTPNDTLFQYQYALSNTGQQIGTIPGSPRGQASADIKATAGWEETKGSSNVVIAVIDTGIDLSHPDLKAKLKSPGRDFINDDLEADDDNGHGSMVAGIAAAETNNREGIAGVAWNARLLPVKALNATGVGPSDKVAEAIRWAADNGAGIINLSLGSETASNTIRDACKYAFDKGVFIAAAAGNGGGAVHYPAAYDNTVFAVAATDYNDARADFSNTGPEVDAAAPGVRILAPYPQALTPAEYLPYAYGGGTSFATAHVSGLAALIKGLKPGLTPAQIMHIIRYSADDVNAAQLRGTDEQIGYGRINLEKALVPLILKK
ncbi:MAG: peptidase S8 [Candidatus Aminicenantes bacterium]|nr:peptidase S8 [Candidatus Aminicenantes bacterium]